ncbi:MAG: serine hydrolase domain-containing protein [Gemmatimonadales bacterium]
MLKNAVGKLRRGSLARPAPGGFPWLLTLVLANLLVATEVDAQFTPFEAAIADFDAEVAAGVAQDAAGCVSVAVFIGDDIVWSRGYGWADIEHRVACTENSIGRTGSISKSFTAVLMMQLVERGLIGLDDPVVDYLPELRELADPPPGMRPITFRMLASHTAGLIREPRLEGAASGSIYRWEEKVMESIPHTGFETPPGTEYSYSNIGFGILGLALSRAAGVPFMTLVEDQIFRPLGMTSSTYVVNTPEMAARLSVGYSRDRDTGEVSAERATREHFGRGYKVPNGGIYSTVGDLAKFAAAVLGVSPVPILSVESRAAVVAPQPSAENYGLGFSVRTDGDMTFAGHGGSVAGYNAQLLFQLDSKIGIAVLRTTGYNPPVADLLRRLVAADREHQ